MVYNIVKHHRGLIDVYSEEKLGSTFNVYMPVLQREEAVDELSRQESLVKGEGLVLVVDDERLMREVAKGILEESGYEVLLAVNGEEGIDMFKKHRAGITAVLLDMVMPKKSGKETYIAIKEIDPSVKVLLVSGFKQDERVEDLLKLGVDGFVQKPYSLEDLSSALYTVVNPNAA
ncbi:MAG: response regulator, partial [Deltaproteobacteria bacterium]|nr:response regulator [Deltaproteobacteria bacterium]